MLSKTKKLLFLTTGLAGALVVSSAAGVALSSCTVEAVNGGSNSSDGITLPDTWYNKDINWSDATSLNNLIIDKQGFVYSNKYKTEIIAILPGYESSTLVIPSTVTSITGYYNVTTTTTNTGTTTTKTAKGAFEGLTSITNVKFAGKNIAQIGPRAFYGCTSLQAINLPSSVNLIASEAFKNCSSLNTIDLNNIQYIGANAFENAFTTVPYGSISLNLNNTVLIAASAFAGSTGIGTIDFSKNTTLTQIAENAFSGCTNLSSDIDLSSATKLITIGSSTTPSTLGSSFANTAITNIYLPSSLRTIATQTFNGCANLINVGPKGNTIGFTAVESISGIYNQAFAGTNITSVNISTITSITPLQAGAFSGMANLIEVNLGSTITTIPAACFANCTALTSLSLPASITSISGGTPTFTTVTFESGASGTVTTPPNISFGTVENYPPFYGSGLTSIDLSTITSYQTTTNSTLNLPNTLFYNCPSLTTVTLKEGTTAIGEGSFALTPVLTTINTGTTTTEGFIASSNITSVGQYAFWQSGISSVDLSAITASTFNTLQQVTFTSCPNLTTITLPATITTIANYAVSNTPKLSTVNFDKLTKLSTINASNFSSSLLTKIDLSNTVLTSIGVASFKNLPTEAQAYFPTTLNDGFQGIFTDTNSNTIPFNFPNGINSAFFVTTATQATNITLSSSGVMQNIQTATSGKANVVKNTSNLNLLTATNVKSIGAKTFFESSKLSSLTFNASAIVGSSNTKHMFTANTGTTSNSDIKVDASNGSGSYKTANVPFGNNELLTSINYINFTTNTAATIDDVSSEGALFNTTDSLTWQEVSKVINSLSYQESPTTTESANASKPNMSSWLGSEGVNSPMNPDAILSFTDSSLTVSNSYENASQGSSSTITIDSNTNEKTIIHNGVTWTYTNDGSNIKLVGSVNMYKATTEETSSSSFLVFFNQSTYSDVSDATTIYYVPHQTPITVTLTIATATTSNS